jgi:hypothetical protein
MTESAAGEPRVGEHVEDHVPLEGIRETIEMVVTSHGGAVLDAAGANAVGFRLPIRQGIGASGEIHGTIRWEGDPADGILRITSDGDVVRPRASHIAILVAGAVGSLLFILWPFYPALGPASWVGGALAFAAYFLTLRRTHGGTLARLLGNIADVQRDS